jgi:O-antigen/teichoic acid export membrane protein
MATESDNHVMTAPAGAVAEEQAARKAGRGAPEYAAPAAPAEGGGPAYTRSRKHTLSVLFFSLQPLILSAVMLPATIYVIRTLGAKSYGQWVLATTIVGTIVFLNNLGLRGPFVRFVAQHPEQGEQALAEQLGLRLALSSVVGVVAMAACLVMGHSNTVIFCTALASVAMVMVTIAATLCDVLQALERFTVNSLTTIFSGVVLTSTAVIIAWAGGGPVGVAAAYISGPMVVVPLLWWIINKHHYRVRLALNWKRAVEMVWKARYFGAQQLLSTLSINITPLVVSQVMGETSLGFFSAGALLADRLTAIPDGIGGAVYPAVAKAAKRGGRVVLQTVGHYLLLAMLVCVPATVCGTVFAHLIAQMFFPTKWEVCEQVIRITIWILPLTGLEYVFSNSLNALHKDAAQAWASLWGISHLVLAVILVSQFGMIGACWAMVLRPVVRLAMILPCIVSTFRPLFRGGALVSGEAVAAPVSAAEV